MRTPVRAALLIAASAWALSGCVSNKPAVDALASAAAESVPAQEQQAAASAAPMAGSAQQQAGYRDPRMTNVAGMTNVSGMENTSGVQAAGMAQAPGQPASAMPEQTAPANIGGLAMQSTGINAQAMSIFSVKQRIQNNPTSTTLQPSGGVGATRSSVYSSQVPVDPAPQQPALAPRQSSQNTSTTIDPVQTASLATSALPGQSMNALYSAPKQNLLTSLSGLLQKASLPGATRVAPNGLRLQNDKVEVGCFKPDLLKVIKAVEGRFGRPATITSGYRDPERNRMVGGAEESMHMSCEAADFQIDGVSKWDIANYIRSLPDRGGVGTYCHTDSIHLDTGRNRDWNWGCGRKPATATLARAL